VTDFTFSDLHLGHAKTLELFTRPDGSPLRDFPDVDTMNNTIINNINKTVGVKDRLIVVGDVVINKKFLPLSDGINCTNRILIGGNHDNVYEELQKYFGKIYGCLEYDNCILTHIPIHPSQKYRFKNNIHGHLHFGQVGSNEFVSSNEGYKEKFIPDSFYVNVSVEMVNYTPVELRSITRK
jgi:calcineurin-like phosphoesterase family protein